MQDKVYAVIAGVLMVVGFYTIVIFIVLSLFKKKEMNIMKDKVYTVIAGVLMAVGFYTIVISIARLF